VDKKYVIKKKKKKIKRAENLDELADKVGQLNKLTY